MSSIANTIKNPRLHDANRPFGGAAMVRQPMKPTDPATLEICNDPLPEGRSIARRKYDPLFAALKPGQAIKCQPSEAGRVSGALRKWLDTNKKPGSIRSVKDYGDGRGRVWWICEEKIAGKKKGAGK